MMSFTHKRIEFSDIDDILAIQDIIIDTMGSTISFYPDSRNDLENYIKYGFGLAIYEKSDIIAYRVVKSPGRDDSFLRYFPDFFPIPLKVLHFESSAVHPDYRGQGLHQKLNQMSLQIIRTEKLADLVCNAIYPLNFPSLKNNLRIGAKIIKIRKVYDGKIRCLLANPINQRISIQYDKQYIEMPLQKFEEIAELLDDGYIGHAYGNESIFLSRINKVCSIGDQGDNHA